MERFDWKLDRVSAFRRSTANDVKCRLQQQQQQQQQRQGKSTEQSESRMQSEQVDVEKITANYNGFFFKFKSR